ncbi:2Fe-2S iron-sulfur cluster-binding protein [Brevibacillus parabrevis]|uniref:2Fe-2S iron-sulfur cluster-binding protein n=1 Tax=Brevibacillus parabrevis TaxID=54914 RepID=UPI001C2118E5|nr:2Fe-2S iron-sulfur cluster-binding protein [Brevibacillus parabrevis]MBU8712144.1 2Fe-2S iron-sulfur cluster binding domain-containing protein [Brevibacillus parabrevis]MDR5001226.1 2Fe-2S iron-sulfur cluster-binding protein [Brevibacillus parabrevis]
MGKVTFLPGGKSVKARAGQSLVSVAGNARIVIPQRCGGHASCLMCRVIVESGELAPPTVLELRKMPEQDLQQGLRLACQAKATENDCTVRIPESRLKSVVAAALERQRLENEE